jgi:cardiolipin synthase
MSYQLHIGNEKLLNLIIRDIEQANDTIHIQMYIIADDFVGNKIKEALIRAAKRKVNIFIVADAYGSHELPNTYIQELKDNNIYFRFFNKIIPFKNWQFGRRLHHKIITIDDKIAYTGGINLADKYFLNTPWLDFVVRTDNHEIVLALKELCAIIYNKKPFKKPKYPPQILINDYARNKIDISRTYKKLISEAQSEILIIAAYFLPSLSFRRKLKKSIKKGVSITFLTGETSDVKIVKYAMEHLYYWMLKKNIRLLEYQPSIVHGKLMVADNKIITVGSYNLNKLSDVGSLELNFLINDASFIEEFNTLFTYQILPNCKQIDITYTQHLAFWKKIRNYISYYIVRIGLRVLTFFNRKEKNLHPKTSGV